MADFNDAQSMNFFFILYFYFIYISVVSSIAVARQFFEFTIDCAFFLVLSCFFLDRYMDLLYNLKKNLMRGKQAKAKIGLTVCDTQCARL